ncbi:transposase [Nocardia testacea]|uniref:transposase n=1 Tax=Nocardia testacea TaxID=248551 RepID=UPI003570A72F
MQARSPVNGSATAAQAEPPRPPGAEPPDHVLGRSRGGWGTKLHPACENGLKPLSMSLTGGQAGDSPQMPAVLDAIAVPQLGGGQARTRPDRVLGDKAYSSRANREYLRRRRIRATIAVPADQAGHRRRRGSGGGRAHARPQLPLDFETLPSVPRLKSVGYIGRGSRGSPRRSCARRTAGDSRSSARSR